jgi:hypothetical protein
MKRGKDKQSINHVTPEVKEVKKDRAATQTSPKLEKEYYSLCYIVRI